MNTFFVKILIKMLQLIIINNIKEEIKPWQI